MKRFLRMVSTMVAGVMICSVILTGCGSDKAKVEDPTPTAELAVNTEAVAKTEDAAKLPLIGNNLQYDPNVPVNDGKDITIKFWYDNPGPDAYARYKQPIEDYMKLHTNIKIEVNGTLGWGDYWQKLPVAIQSGTGPDIMHFHFGYTSTFIPDLAASYPEDVMPVDKLKADFGAIDPFIIDGKIYTLPVANMTGAIVYNKKMWADAGLTEKDFPKTWEQLREVAKKLTKRDGNKILVNGMDINEPWLFTALNYQKGYFNFKEDGKISQLNNPGLIEAAKFFQDMIKVDKVYAPSTGAVQERIANGKSAMAYAWTWMDSWLAGNAKGKMEWGWFAIPTFDGAKVVERNSPEATPIVNAKSSNEAKAVAFDFIKFYLASDSYQVELGVNIGCVPQKNSAKDNEKVKNNSLLSVVSPYIDKTIWLGFIHNQVDQNVVKILNDEMLINLVDPATALKKFDDEAAKVAPDFNLSTKERLSPLASNLK